MVCYLAMSGMGPGLILAQLLRLRERDVDYIFVGSVKI